MNDLKETDQQQLNKYKEELQILYDENQQRLNQRTRNKELELEQQEQMLVEASSYSFYEAFLSNVVFLGLGIAIGLLVGFYGL